MKQYCQLLVKFGNLPDIQSTISLGDYNLQSTLLQILIPSLVPGPATRSLRWLLVASNMNHNGHGGWGGTPGGRRPLACPGWERGKPRWGCTPDPAPSLCRRRHILLHSAFEGPAQHSKTRFQNIVPAIVLYPLPVLRGWCYKYALFLNEFDGDWTIGFAGGY